MAWNIYFGAIEWPENPEDGDMVSVLWKWKDGKWVIDETLNYSWREGAGLIVENKKIKEITDVE